MKRKLFALLLVVALTVGLVGVSLAATETDGSIRVDNIGEFTELDLFQIIEYEFFDDGDPDTPGIYTPIIKNGYKAAFVEAINASAVPPDPAFTTGTADAVLLEYITDYLNDSGFARELAELLKKKIPEDPDFTTRKTSNAGNPWARDTAAKTLIFDPVPMGYYLIVDKTVNAEYNAVVMLKPMDPNVVVTLKTGDAPPIDKIIVGDDNTVKIGDTRTFRITGTVPSYADHEWFTYTITDELSTGLTFEEIVSVKVNGVDYTLTDDNYTEPTGQVLTFTFDQDDIGVAAGAVIVIEYKVTINEMAIVDGNGNGVIDKDENLSYNGVVDFYNGPGTEYEGEKKVVELYTFGIEVTKKDETGTKLPGVTFVLKDVGDENVATDDYVLLFDYLDVYTDENNEPDTYYYKGRVLISTLPTDAEGKIIYPNDAILTTDDDGLIDIRGLDADTYNLEELATLPGYNMLEGDEVITIRSPEDNNQVVITYLARDVINYSGIELPGTGGMGTIWFTVIGGVIMGGAAVALIVSRKRKSRVK